MKEPKRGLSATRPLPSHGGGEQQPDESAHLLEDGPRFGIAEAFENIAQHKSRSAPAPVPA
eukprot:CAMPEP_0194593394 /NCGR_PEP_ID=MMETSP0292-20121207/23473_1 /TAXON_ID=39354 /ORGANISM="Heterosigma akashiwo, Strain CCMP2393" /LENGTH=60 /DNA_ID=CAMNT_0039452327 /DNA_START=26 /DNA_END=205 /DNA_ORIENTATION=+